MYVCIYVYYSTSASERRRDVSNAATKQYDINAFRACAHIYNVSDTQKRNRLQSTPPRTDRTRVRDKNKLLNWQTKTFPDRLRVDLSAYK